MYRGVYPEYLYYQNKVTFVTFKVTFTFQEIQFSASKTAGGNNSVGIRQVVKTKYCGCGSRRSREYHQKRYTGGYKDLFLQNTILQGIILPLNVVFSLPPALVISKKPPDFEENCKRCFIGFGLVLCFDLVLHGGSSDMRQ